MTPKDKKNSYEDLSGPEDSAEDEYSLEEILAEYGAGTEERLLSDPSDEECPKRRSEPLAPEELSAAELEAQALRQVEKKLLSEACGELPLPPRPIPLEDVVKKTVDAVMEEEPLLKRPRRGLFSRRNYAETEELYASPEPKAAEEEEPEPVIGPEKPFDEAAEEYRRLLDRQGRALPAALLLAVLLAAPTAVEELGGYTVPFWTGETLIQTCVSLGALFLICLIGRSIFARAFRALRRKRCTGDLLISLSCLVAVGDCFSRLFLVGRSDTMPYASAACAAMAFALWGEKKESRALYDTFRTAAMGDPSYLVTDTERGACKQAGRTAGFYSDALRDGLPVLWQTVLLPVVLTASVIFALLSSVGQGRSHDFLLNWSAILSAGTVFALPLCGSLPLSALARRLQKSGCAVAGCVGAERINRKRSIILTDTDLFPPGTISLNGIKVFGEELPKAASYAASLIRASGCGLKRLFDELMLGEGGHPEELDDFSFYEEGGYSANIRGEAVLLGTASFLRKMGVRLPGGINLRTGVFLAVDRQLAAVFAVKYLPGENVDWALRMLRRSRITPILASRDANITPALLKRKFGKRVKVDYPELSARLALSEQELGRGLPRALLYREGLLPYAETVTGGRRLCAAARRSTQIALGGSVCGTLLAYYLTFEQAYSLLTPTALLLFLLLWTVPPLLLADWTGRF